jgi:hypothetical protein
MPQKVVIGGPWSSGVLATLGLFLVVSVVTAATVAVGGALLYEPAFDASLERQWVAEVERENGEVCSSLGMTSGASRLTCAEALARVRRV